MKQALVLMLALVGSAGLEATTMDAERAAEAARLRTEGAGAASRDGKRLVLMPLRRGDTPVVMVDQSDCTKFEDCQEAFWHGLRARQRFHEIYMRHYEGDRWQWIDRVSGQRTDMEMRPSVSSNAQLVVVASDQEAYGRQGLWAWQVTDSGLSLRFALEDLPFRFEAWTTPAEARVLRLSYPEHTCPNGVRGQPHRLLIDAKLGGRLEPLQEPPRCI